MAQTVFARFSLVFLLVAFLAAEAEAQQPNPLIFGVDQRPFSCGVMINSFEFRNAISFIGFSENKQYYLTSYMAAKGPLMLVKNVGDSSSIIFNATRVNSGCDSMEIEFEQVKKFRPGTGNMFVVANPPNKILFVLKSVPSKDDEFANPNLNVEFKNEIGEPALMFMNNQRTYRRFNPNAMSSLIDFASEYCSLSLSASEYKDHKEECIKTYSNPPF